MIYKNTFLNFINRDKGTKNLELNKENILKFVTEEQIFSLFLGTYVDLKRKYYAPYRNDKHADCFFWHNKYGKLYFVDFANTTITHLDCFSLGQLTHNLSFFGVLSFINKSFNLKLENISLEEKSLLNGLKTPNFKNKQQEIKKDNTKLLCDIRDFNNQDIDYWKQYNITLEQLKKDKVYPVSRFFAKTSEKQYSIKLNQSYAFTEFKRKLKIYSPDNKEYKWITNCDSSDIGNWDNTINKEYNTDFLIITKSYKDCRVLRNLGFNSIWLQNEKVILPEKIISKLKSNGFID